MSKIDKLADQFRQGRISRREFLSGTAALGLALPAATALFGDTARAAEPKRGGLFRVGLGHGSTTDPPTPAGSRRTD